MLDISGQLENIIKKEKGLNCPFFLFETMGIYPFVSIQLYNHYLLKRFADNRLQSNQLHGLHVMCTINALCLDSLPTLLDIIVQWKQENGNDFPNFSLNILRFPSFQSPLVLPNDIRIEYKNNLQVWFDNNKDNEFLHQMELNQLQRLIDYLDVVKTPHADAAEQSVLQQDFKKFYVQYDQRRNKNFVKTFPRLESWYNSL